MRYRGFGGEAPKQGQCPCTPYFIHMRNAIFSTLHPKQFLLTEKWDFDR
jgi:hypothetical protein